MLLVWLILGILAIGFILQNWVDRKQSYPRSITVLRSSDYAWGDGKDFDELAVSSPDFASILADTTIAKLEADWDKAHPSMEQQLAEKDQLITQKSALIVGLQKEADRNWRKCDCVKCGILKQDLGY